MTANSDPSTKQMPRSTPQVTGSRRGWLCATVKSQLFLSEQSPPTITQSGRYHAPSSQRMTSVIAIARPVIHENSQSADCPELAESHLSVRVTH